MGPTGVQALFGSSKAVNYGKVNDREEYCLCSFYCFQMTAKTAQSNFGELRNAWHILAKNSDATLVFPATELISQRTSLRTNISSMFACTVASAQTHSTY